MGYGKTQDSKNCLIYNKTFEKRGKNYKKRYLNERKICSNKMFNPLQKTTSNRRR